MAGKKKKAGVFLPACVDRWIDEFGDDFGFQPLVRPAPTNAFPGTQEKVEEMRRRVRRGQPVFAKGDRSFWDGTTNAELDARAEEPKYTSWRGDNTRGIEQSHCGDFRYRYWRSWNKKLPTVSFIGLSAQLEPSGLEDRKITAIATRLGCGGYQMLNLFAKKVSDNRDLWNIEDIVGDANDRVIRLAVLSTSFTICCWGIGGVNLGRAARVLWAVSKTIPKTSVFCFGVNRALAAATYPVSLDSVDEKAEIVQMPWQYMDLGDEGRKKG